MKKINNLLYIDNIEQLKDRIITGINYFNEFSRFFNIKKLCKEEIFRITQEAKKFFKFYPKENSKYIDEALYHYFASKLIKTTGIGLYLKLFNSYYQNNLNGLKDKGGLERLIQYGFNDEISLDLINMIQFLSNEIEEVNKFIEMSYGRDFYKLEPLKIDNLSLNKAEEIKALINKLMFKFSKFESVVFLLNIVIKNFGLRQLIFYIEIRGFTASIEYKKG